MTFLLIWLCGIVDRIRGDDYDVAFNLRLLDKITYGWLIAALLNHPLDWFTVPLIALFVLGISPGWGAAMGAAVSGISPKEMESNGVSSGKAFKYPFWMIGFLKKSAYLSLLVRGVITGLPFLPMMYFDFNMLSVLTAYAIAFPLGCALAVLLNMIVKKHPDWAWEQAELFRGWIASSIIATWVYLL